jgi:hypothetical protein
MGAPSGCSHPGGQVFPPVLPVIRGPAPAARRVAQDHLRPSKKSETFLLPRRLPVSDDVALHLDRLKRFAQIWYVR